MTKDEFIERGFNDCIDAVKSTLKENGSSYDWVEVIRRGKLGITIYKWAFDCGMAWKEAELKQNLNQALSSLSAPEKETLQ